MSINRREFLALATQAPAVAAFAPAKARVGLVHSTHSKLANPAGPDAPLDYARVRDMVWKAIEYGTPKAGSLEKKIPARSWVVIKPNIVFLKPQPGYASGDVTDLRVTRAVLEYVARKSRAARITIAEGGSYRNLKDPSKTDTVYQNDRRVTALEYEWPADEFPGVGGSLAQMLREMSSAFPNIKFEYVDLAYDAVRDASGAYRRIEVPKAPNGTGAFGARPDYFVTNTIRNCDFLIDVPVMKVHAQCGITACLKNYVGTAPREAYQFSRGFWNGLLHEQHSVDNRIDPFIVDLASFHPPDYAVVDGLRGLQFSEHNANRPGQMIRSNLVMAGEDPVALDACAARLLGFNPHDIDYLHHAALRQMGNPDLRGIALAGDELDRYQRRWEKPRDWYGRCNREWMLSHDGGQPVAAWTRYSSPTDSLNLVKWSGGQAQEGVYGAAVKVIADGNRKAFLWIGLRGRVAATVNGQKVAEEENRTRYRVGQFRAPVELRSGENLIVFRVQPVGGQAQLSALITGPQNDGDTVDGVTWRA